LLRSDGTLAGALPPFTVSLPHLPEITEIVARCGALRRLAMIYQRFLDGIEQTERFYHEDDVPQQLRDAARLASAEERYIPR